jgi:hypothetical protein
LTLDVVEMRGPDFSAVGETGRRLQCDANLRISSTGDGDAVWEGGVMRFFFGVPRTEPVDSVTVTAADLRGSWELTEVLEAPRSAWWVFFADFPFDVEIDFRYRVNGRVTRSVTSRIPCGTPELDNTPPPAIARFDLVSPGPLEPTGVLELQYEVNSAAGLWETQVVFSGPCDAERTFDETLESSVARTVLLQIPRGCELDVPITLALRVLDAGLRQVVRTVETSLRLVDETPPSLHVLFFPPDFGSGASAIGGEYFVGEPIELELTASDNVEVKSIGWEVLPSGDTWTQDVSAPFARERLDIAVRPEWLGEMQIRFSTADVHGNVRHSTWSEPGALFVYPTKTRPTYTATVAGEIREFLIDEPRGVVHLLQSNQRRLAVMSTTTMQVVQTLALPSYPTDLALSPGGDSLIVALPLLGAIAFVDLTQPTLAADLWHLENLDPALEQRPVRVRATTNRKVFIGLEASVAGAATLLELDLVTGVERVRTDAGDGGDIDFGTLEVSPDRTVLVVSGGLHGIQRYEASTDAFGAPRSITPRAGTPSLNGPGTRFVVGLNVFDESVELIRRVDSRTPTAGNFTPPSILTPDGEHVYHLYGTLGMIRSRTSDGGMVDRTPLPFMEELRISPSGAILVLVHSDAKETSEIAVVHLGGT